MTFTLCVLLPWVIIGREELRCNRELVAVKLALEE